MKLHFKEHKANTKTVQFRIDPDTHKKLTFLRNFYKVRTGELLKHMIDLAYDGIKSDAE